MILYHVVTIYQLLHSIIYKELFHKDQVCYIQISDCIKENYPHFMQMEGLFFDKVFVFAANDIFIDTENNNEVVGNNLNQNKINLQDFSEIIVGNPNSNFGIYLLDNRIDFTFLEEESGLITKKICKINTQGKGSYDTNLEHFDLIDRMGEMKRSFIDKVLVFFCGDQKIQIKEDSTILLTQKFSDLIIMSFEEQKKIYKQIIDYFVPNSRLVVHPHLDDLMFYEDLFPQATILNKQFPSELIPFVFNEKPQTIMTLPSTSINTLVKYFRNCINFSPDFEGHFNITHRYYCAVKIINMLIEVDDYEIYEMNSDKLLLENLLNVSGNQLRINSINNRQIPNKGIVIIDDLNHDTLLEAKEVRDFLTSIDRESIIILINSNKEYLFYDYPNKEIFERMVPVEIHINSTVDETDHYSEIIFVYSKRKDTRNMINEQTFEKTLRSSNEMIKVKAKSEEQLRIKILEGILEATEKRLNHYIKMESELREKLKLEKT